MAEHSAVTGAIAGSSPARRTVVTLAQTVRAPGSEPGRCGFEPRTSPHTYQTHPFIAGIAQQAERLHRKQQVVGSTPTLGSNVLALVAERLKALDCKSGERKLHVSSNLTECSNSFSM